MKKFKSYKKTKMGKGKSLTCELGKSKINDAVKKKGFRLP